MKLKRYILFFVFLIGCILPAAAQTNTDYSACFFPGEVSEYKISWMGLPLAWSKSTTELITENGKEYIRLHVISKSYATYSKIYKVDDEVEVIIDPETALPLRLDFKIQEGSRKKNMLTTFDHTKKIAIHEDRIAKTTEELPIDSDTRDIYTFIYTLRGKSIEEITAKPQILFVEGKRYTLELVDKGKDTIKLSEYGKVPSNTLEPVAEFNGLFLRQGKVMCWVSEEERRMITCIKAKIPVGKITIKLDKVSGPGTDFWATEDE